MAKKVVRLTEEELHSIIKECVNEILTESGGFSLGVSKRHRNDYQRAQANGIDFIATDKGKTFNVDSRLDKAKQMEISAREKLLSLFANVDFIFTTDMEHSNTHIISYHVNNILAIRGAEVLLEGLWTDLDTNQHEEKRIKVDCNTQSVKYYSPILKSPNAILNTYTKTKQQWDAFVKELCKLHKIYNT